MLHIKLKQGDVLLIDGVAVICSGPLAKLSVLGDGNAERVYNCSTIDEINAARAFHILKIALRETNADGNRIFHGWPIITINYPDGHTSVGTFLGTGNHYYIDSKNGTELRYFINNVQTYLEKQNDIL